MYFIYKIKIEITKIHAKLKLKYSKQSKLLIKLATHVNEIEITSKLN